MSTFSTSLINYIFLFTLLSFKQTQTCSRRPSSAVASDPLWITGRRPVDAFALNQWSIHSSDLSAVSNPDDVSREGRVMGINNSFTPNATSSPRSRSRSSSSPHNSSSVLLPVRAAQILFPTPPLSDSLNSTQLPSSDFHSFGSDNEAFEAEVDQIELAHAEITVTNIDDSEAVIFDRATATASYSVV